MMPRVQISIHALREEGDKAARMRRSTGTIFLSTPSARRATAGVNRVADNLDNFYPRPPRGGRPIDIINGFIGVLFLSTPSARRATPCSLLR